jgi:hypothetical protein
MTTLLQRPTGQGTVALNTFGTGSYHWDRIAEETADDTDGIKNDTDVVYILDRFTFPALGITGTINSVRLYGRFKIPLNVAYAKVGLYIGTTDYYATSWEDYASYTELYREWTVNPADSPNPFTVAVLDAASYDVALQAGLIDKANLDPALCSQFWRVVDYTPAAGGTARGKLYIL